MVEDHSYLIAAAQLAGLALATRWLLTPKETPAKKLHVDYGAQSSLPLPIKIISYLPDSIRIPLLIKSSKPSPPKDSIDILGTDEVDPYEKREIVPGKIWGVQYKCLVDPQLAKFMEMFLEGTAEERQASAIANAPDHLKDVLKADFKRKEEYDALSEVEKAKLGGDMFQEMYVIKLDDGGLLLYNPVRMHPQMVDWIKERGEVKYIVSGSSAHTNHLPKTAETFPDAKIICASIADAKCQFAGMRPADYLYDLRRDEEPQKQFVGRATLQDALDEFNGKIKLFHIRGDVMTEALFLLVHSHLFVIDLIYTACEQEMKNGEFETGTSPIQTGGRIFTYSLITEKAKVSSFCSLGSMSLPLSILTD
jgi:hypothetical protein